MPILLRSSFRLRPMLAPALYAVVVLCACSSRASVAARATVETFYTAIQADNLPVVQDNIAVTAPSQFQQRVVAAAAAAQAGGAAEQAVQLVRVNSPVIIGNTAHVGVVFADGRSDTVDLTREGERWKVVSSGRLG